MKPILFLLRRWDDLTHAFQSDVFKLPKQVHAPLTTKQMTVRLQDALDAMLKTEGFTLDGELTWTRPHPPLGLAVFGVHTTTKYAPEVLGVSLFMGFRVLVIESAIEAVCLATTEKKKKHPFASHPLHCAYRDPDRPKRRPSFPLGFTFWNVDFRESVAQKIKVTIQHYALPFFDRVKTVSDLKTIGMRIDNRTALLVRLGEEESGLRLLDDDLQKQKRYAPEMRARLERLRESIQTGELQRLLAANDH